MSWLRTGAFPALADSIMAFFTMTRRSCSSRSVCSGSNSSRSAKSMMNATGARDWPSARRITARASRGCWYRTGAAAPVVSESAICLRAALARSPRLPGGGPPSAGPGPPPASGPPARGPCLVSRLTGWQDC